MPRTEKKVELFLTVEMVRKEFISLNIYKAIGPDEIHPRMLKELVDYVTIPLFFIIKKISGSRHCTNWNKPTGN